MTGEELKTKLSSTGVSQSELARRLEMSQQSFNQCLKASDIKTGFLEKIAAVLGVDMSYFYPSQGVVNTNIQATNGSGNQNINGTQTIGEQSTLLDIIRQQQETINKLLAK